MTGIVGRRYLLHGRPVEVLVQWGLKSKGESHGGPRNVRIRFLDKGTETIRPFHGLRRLPSDTAGVIHTCSGVEQPG